MASNRIATNEARRGTAGHLGGGDDHVGVSSGADDEVAAAIEGFFAEFGRVAAATFGVDAAKIHVEKLCTKRTDLFSSGGAHVVGLNDCAEPAGGGDGLQAGDSSADDEHACRRNGSGGGHQHRERAAAALRRR